MEEFKRMTVWELLILLQKKVKMNAASIKSNNGAINGIDSRAELTPDVLQAINQLTQINTNLTKENQQFLNLFNSIVSLQKEHKNLLQGILETKNFEPLTLVPGPESNEEFLQKTIRGNLELNETHPFINDKEFLEKLLDTWEENEEYEKCAKVKSILAKL